MIFLLKVTLLFSLGWAVAGLSRGRSAAARHLVWTLTLAGVLALALAAPVAPTFPVRLAAWPVSTAPGLVPSSDATVAPAATTEFGGGGANSPSRVVVGATPSRPTARRELGAGQMALVLWLAGAGAMIGWIILGHLGLARLMRRATPLADPEWRSLLATASAESGISAPVRLLRSAAVGSPITWGMRRPIVLLPEDADSWPVERRRVVLAHELAHVARADYAAQLLASTVCALYWFHPLAWTSARRLRTESERAADDQVLSRGIPGIDYATHLLDVAHHSRAMRAAGMVAIGMASRSHLEGRLLAVLDAARTRRAPRPRVRAAAWGALALILGPLTMIRPMPRLPDSPAIGVVSPARHPTLEAAGSPPSGREPRAERDSVFEREVEAAPGDELLLDLESGGEVTLRAWDEPRVKVVAHLAGRNWPDTRVSLERSGGRVRLHAWQEVERRGSSTSHRFEIMVPRRFDIRFKSAGGGVTILGLEGNFTGETGGGGYVLARVRGEAELSTGGGDIRVSDSELRGQVSTGGGVVRLSRVRGGLHASSGSGPVMYTEGREGETGDLDTGRLHIEKAGGDVILEAAPAGAEIHTGGGRVRVGASAGLVSASTGGGDIVIGPASGSVSASTGAGNVQVTIEGDDGSEHSVEISSGTGSAVLLLPPGFSGRFDLETAYTENFGRRTRIESDWELVKEESTRWDDRNGTPRKYVRAFGEAGHGGGLIKVRIVNGDITVRRGPR